MPQLLTAKELAEELLRTPDAIVVIDDYDIVGEYAYAVVVHSATKDSVCIRLAGGNTGGPFIVDSDGKLIEP